MQTNRIERHAVTAGRAAMLAAAVLAGGCAQLLGIDELSGSDGRPDAGPGDFAVRGSATGVLGAVALELSIDGDSELLAVTQDGPFAFETRLPTGASYTVALADADTPCALRSQTGVIAGADTAIELTCTGASLASVVVSGIAPAVALVPGTNEYVVDLPLLQPAVTLTATVAMAGDTLAIAGVKVDSGAPSAEIVLSLGDNPVDIVVENELGWRRTYRVVLRRAAQLAQYAYGKASNTGAGDDFGASVALSGDTLVVGAPGEDSAAEGMGGNQTDDSLSESGAVYVFRRAGAVWQQEAYLKASNTGRDDRFGASVALSGDTLAVGARTESSAAEGVGGNEDNDAAEGSGAVYVFRRTGTTWQQEAYLKASNTGSNDSFGTSVAVSGDLLAVGATGEDSAAEGVGGDQDDDSVTESGAVYVFRRDGTTWQQEAYLKASNTGGSDFFGTSMALAGDTLAVGATGEDSAAQGVDGDQTDDSAARSGAVYVFRRDDSGWQQEAYLKASNTEGEDEFGLSVALSGETLVVGAPFEDSAAPGVGGDQSDEQAPASGAVYVFRRAGATWQQEKYIKASNPDVNDQFGTSVALSGDVLAVGARGEDSGAKGVNGDQGNDERIGSGAVYVFRRTGVAWLQEAYLKASTPGVNDFFGSAVALSGDALVAGATGESSAAQGVGGDETDVSSENSGAVYVFH
jgi:hypothetical protein